MSLTFTYATLVAAIKSHVDGDTSSTAGGLGATANIDVVIQSGEEKVLRDLPLSIFDAEASITLTINSVSVTKPTGYVAWRYANFTDANSKKQALDLRSLEYIEDYNPNPAATGTPKFLADYDSTTWKVAPTPSATLAGKALYVKRPDSLVTATTGTWLSQNAGLLLFRACLVCAEEFIGGDERIPIWKTDYQDALAVAGVELRHLIRPDFNRLAAMPTPK